MSMISKDTILESGRTFEDIRRLRVESNNKSLKADAKSFKELFGDLSSYTFTGELLLGVLNLNSLEGMPREVIGEVYIDSNPWLKNLKHLSQKIVNMLSVACCENLESLKGIGNLNLVTVENGNVGDFANHIFLRKNPNLFDISDLSEETISKCKTLFVSQSPVLLTDLIKLAAQRRSLDGDFSFLESDYSIEELERLYSFYEKLGFDQRKFDRALALL